MKLVDILARELKVWPEGARYILFDHANSCYAYLGQGYSNLGIDCSDFDDDATDKICTTVYRTQWQAAVDALKAENCAHLWVGWSDTEACELCNKTRKIYVDWDGAGSPPIGALVQDHSDIGGPVYMAEVVSVEDRLVAIKRPGSLKVVDAHALRPVRTPEQIAAAEKQRAVAEMEAQISKWGLTSDYNGMCQAIYDAGYRKFEIVDN